MNENIINIISEYLIVRGEKETKSNFLIYKKKLTNFEFIYAEKIGDIDTFIFKIMKKNKLIYQSGNISEMLNSILSSLEESKFSNKYLLDSKINLIANIEFINKLTKTDIKDIESIFNE